jgi:hypothetical protein
MKYSELDKLAKECEYEIDRNAIRTKYRTRSNLIEIANDIPDTIYFSTSKCGFSDIEFFKKCIELAETPPEEREDERRFIVPLPELVTTDGKQQYLTHKDCKFFASRRDETLQQIWKEEHLELIPEQYRQFAEEFDEEKEY